MRIGKVTENVLKRSVWKETGRKAMGGAAGYSDCALFDLQANKDKGPKGAGSHNGEGEILSSTSPCTLALQHPARYALVSATNNIYASGGEADMAELTVLLPADAEEKQLKDMIKEAVNIAGELGLAIKGGHTEVTPIVNAPMVTATVTGHRAAPYTCGHPASVHETKGTERSAVKAGARGDLEIYISKWIGLGGTAILAEEMEKEIAAAYPPFIEETGKSFGSVKYLSVRDEARIAMEEGAVLMHDISSGGVFAALWEFGEMLGLGLDIDLKAIPIRQETVEITDLLGVNPYQIYGQGALLIAIPAGSGIETAMESAGIPLSLVGHTRPDKDRIIRNGEETRFLDLPQADSLLSLAHTASRW